jgi:hypothetical protein
MRCGIILAAALTATTAITLSTTGARADEWCGYAVKDKALVECGYSTVAQCQDAMGKGGMCFVDPDYALKSERATPLTPAKYSPRKS